MNKITLDDMKSMCDKLSVVDVPKNRSKLILVEALHVLLPCVRPHWWWRLWQYLLFGFRWEAIDE